MPRKATEAAATEKPAAKKRTATPRPRKAGKPTVLSSEHVAERAYYIHLEEGGDAVENWLRAERELVAV
jgi:Protein of unknown function (DUF2934)